MSTKIDKITWVVNYNIDMDIQLINGSWQQTIASLIYNFIQKYELESTTNTQTINESIINESQTIQELINQIADSEQLDPAILQTLLDEIRTVKGTPKKEVITITRYVNTETTKFIYVPRREDVREPIKSTQTLSYDPTDEWKLVEGSNNWLYKEDQRGRKYYKVIRSNRIMSTDEYRRWTNPKKQTTTLQSYSNISSANDIWPS